MDYIELENAINQNQPDTEIKLKELILSIYPEAKVHVEKYYYFGYLQGVKVMVNGVKLPLKKSNVFCIYDHSA